MPSLRILVSRRWLIFALVVIALAFIAWRLGEWQFNRLEERRERNAAIERNEKAGPSPLADVLSVDQPMDKADEWRVVEATGTYAVQDTVVVRYRTRDGAAGVEVVVPLEMADGTSVLVDRGWFATDNRGATSADIPAPPTGEVSITGWARSDATGDSTAVSDQSTRAISSKAIGPALDRELVTGFVVLISESPEADTPLTALDPPELDDGPHFFYGLQWWFFAALAIFGFFYLMYDELRGGRGPWGRLESKSQGAQESPVDGDHDAADE